MDYPHHHEQMNEAYLIARGQSSAGHRLMLRGALNVVLSSEFPRSPTARLPLWALLWVFWSSVRCPPCHHPSSSAEHHFQKPCLHQFPFVFVVHLDF
jgi:hypothetical protein